PDRTTRKRYSGAVIEGTGPISTTLLPPGDDPPGGPSVKSHAVPSTSAASAVVLATACALPGGGEMSTRQNNGPGGSCETFFSATGVISNFCACAAVESSSPVAIIHTKREHCKANG